MLDKKTVLFIVAVLAVTTGVAGLAFAGSGEPGSSSDPLVTKSYVDKAVQESRALHWEVITLQKGEVFTGTAGTEFMLRTGAAVIVDPTGSGIPDITSGTNYSAGKSVPSNHLFTIPRSDKRGIKAVEEAIIMYRGD